MSPSLRAACVEPAAYRIGAAVPRGTGRHATAVAAAVIAIALAGCSSRLQHPPRPPPVTGCLEVPTAPVPDAPIGPAPGDALSDRYVVALQGWANQLLGVITADRIAWRGEHQCIRALQKKGLVE